MVPGFEGGDCPLGVQGVGQRDVNSVEGTVGDQLGISRVNPLNSRPLGKGLGASRVVCSNAGELDFVDELGRLDDRLVRDVRRSDYAEPQLVPPPEALVKGNRNMPAPRPTSRPAFRHDPRFARASLLT